MTSVATKLLDDFESLTLEEQLLVRERVISVTDEIQRKALERLHGASQGKRLLAKHLQVRAEERARGG